MDINKDNYILWITDFYDGTLTAIEKEALSNFLDLNPSLKKEFEAFREISLHPEISTRIDKSSLYKNISDLDPELRAEEFDLLIGEYGTKEDLEQSAGLILTPPLLEYPYKSKLKRIPYRARAFKLAVRGLSAAASIAIIVMLYIFLPGNRNISQSYSTASALPFNIQHKSPNRELTALLKENRILPKEIHIKEAPSAAQLLANDNLSGAIEDIARAEAVEIRPAGYKNMIMIAGADIQNPSNLLQMQEFDVQIDQPDLSPRQFLALNFRKHLLGENIESAENLKAYEVADVSISGLNKLMGWEMKFEKETDGEGRLKAYKFTSQLINLDRKTKIADD